MNIISQLFNCYHFQALFLVMRFICLADKSKLLLSLLKVSVDTFLNLNPFVVGGVCNSQYLCFHCQGYLITGQHSDPIHG